MMIGIAGPGDVGLPLAVGFCEVDHDVGGLDTHGRRVKAPAAGHEHGVTRGIAANNLVHL
jgi:UDP-N-acetyl-D-mannosaminuronate dehydrogenase